MLHCFGKHLFNWLIWLIALLIDGSRISVRLTTAQHISPNVRHVYYLSARLSESNDAQISYKGTRMPSVTYCPSSSLKRLKEIEAWLYFQHFVLGVLGLGSYKLVCTGCCFGVCDKRLLFSPSLNSQSSHSLLMPTLAYL